MTPTLFCFGESGNAYKAALTLTLMGLPWTARFVDFFGGETRTPAFRAVNVMGEVPVYQDGDLTLTQSGAIQLHLVDLTGRFGGENPAERSEVMRWILWDNHKLSSQAGLVRFLLNFLPEDKRDPAVIAFQQGRLMAALKVLEAQLTTQDWVATGAPTIADFACCSYLYYPEPYGFDRAQWPAIDAWLSRLSALAGWAHPYDLMPRGRTTP